MIENRVTVQVEWNGHTYRGTQGVPWVSPHHDPIQLIATTFDQAIADILNDIRVADAKV